jgi:hypothetical protein
MLHAAAAFMEKRVVSINGESPKTGPGRNKGKRRGSRKSRTINHMKLDLNGLSALMNERRQQSSRESSGGTSNGVQGSRAIDRKPTRKHECGKHTRTYWVKELRPEHTATGRTRQGKHGILHAVLKTIEKHDRGSRAEEQIYKLHRG